MNKKKKRKFKDRIKFSSDKGVKKADKINPKKVKRKIKRNTGINNVEDLTLKQLKKLLNSAEWSEREKSFVKKVWKKGKEKKKKSAS